MIAKYYNNGKDGEYRTPKGTIYECFENLLEEFYDYEYIYDLDDYANSDGDLILSDVGIEGIVYYIRSKNNFKSYIYYIADDKGNIYLDDRDIMGELDDDEEE